ncbi:DUF5602 domain-containing protein [Pontibacter sp. Tf4]|uniref:DUF5602 domain-containing protein n=1 Tax=Pontibacter sp. Tf4 TaxID=2761620 RepID=UPI001627847F|nr:DUF5602 domain-containing protein [Pontibacter sp. Tf4]MBB6611087.1 DUF5602 domain-containing protein [Pontibacter sp. Tf4]
MKNLFEHSHRLMQTLSVAAVLLLAGCENNTDVEPAAPQSMHGSAVKGATKVYYGDEAALGNGTAQVWVQTVQGKPTALGIELTEEALTGLLDMDMFEFALPMPGQAHATGYKTVMIGWNPMGHEPEGVYTLPHFDFHFYLQTMGQIMQVQGGEDPEARLLAGTVLPENYTFGPVPIAVPHMGVHWSDRNSPEFSPAGFSRTFIYGSYHDQVTFLEPMITLEYLLSLEPGESVTMEVPSLLVYEDPGYYPLSYTITHTEYGTYIIALTDLVWHNRNK